VLLLEVCGPRGALGRHLPFDVAFTPFAAVLASSIVALPLMVRPARSALEAVPRRYVQAARTLGATPWRAFWRVQLPLARRGVLAGVLLAFFRALGEFGATLMVAGNIPGKTQTLPLAIYDALFLGHGHEALVWVVGVMVLTFAGAVVVQRLQGRTP
jgi:molybdate transport system permease protein